MKSDRSRCLNRELTREMIVGTFIGSVFLVLVVFTIVISGNRLFVGGPTRLTVAFENVGGLRRHDMVLVRGVPVGKVDRLELVNNLVRVKMSLTEPVRLREGYSIKVMQSSMLGGMHLVIDEGRGEPLPEDAELRGVSPARMMEDLGRLVGSVREELVQGGALSNLNVVASDLALLSGRLRRGEGTLGRLLSTNDTLYADLSTGIADLRAIVGRLEAGEGTLGRLLSSDDRLYDDLSATMADIRTVAGRLERGEGTLGKLLSEKDTLYQDLAAAMADLRDLGDRLVKGEGTLGRLLSPDDTLYTDIAASAASLKTITGRLETGEGMLGQLLAPDSPLSRDAEGLVKDLRETIDDMREVAPITTFTSIFFGVF